MWQSPKVCSLQGGELEIKRRNLEWKLGNGLERQGKGVSLGLMRNLPKIAHFAFFFFFFNSHFRNNRCPPLEEEEFNQNEAL